MDFTVDLSQLPPEVAGRVIRKIQHEDRARFDLELLEQRRAKKFLDRVVRPGFNNELGRQSLFMMPTQVHAFRQLYGQLCWADPDFAPWVARQEQHKDFVVPDVGTKIQIGYTGRGWSKHQTQKPKHQ